MAESETKPNFDALLRRQRAILATEAIFSTGRTIVGPAACELPELPEIIEPHDDGEADIRGVKLITDAEGNWRVVIEPIE